MNNLYFAIGIINPWALQWKEAIFQFMEDGPQRIMTLDINSAPRETIERQYAHKLNEPYGEILISALTGQKLSFSVYVSRNEDFYKVMLENKRKVRHFFDRYITQPDKKEFKGLIKVSVHCSGNRKESLTDLGAWAPVIKSQNNCSLREILREKGIETR